jgi:hypothetical protein
MDAQPQLLGARDAPHACRASAPDGVRQGQRGFTLPPLPAQRFERPNTSYCRHATARVPAPISKPPPVRLTARCTIGRRMVRRAAEASSA